MTRLEKILLAVNVAVGLFGLSQLQRANAISDSLLQIEQQAATFESEFIGSDLVIRSALSDFVEPRNLRVQPIFERPDIIGASIELPRGVISRNEGSILYSRIIDSICSYRENKTSCAQHEVQQLEVRYTVHGVPSVNVVAVPQL